MSSLLVTQVESLANTLEVSGNAKELMSVLKSTAFKTNDQYPVSDAQMSALLIVANQYGLNPWTKEIYAYPDKSKGIVPIVGVDGWARIINGHKQFDGIEFEFNEDCTACTCRIFRKDRSNPTVITEYMDECLRPAFTTRNGATINTPWQSHPKRMLRHKALIQCARIAFGFGGLYDQDDADAIVSEPLVVSGYDSEPEVKTSLTSIKHDKPVANIKHDDDGVIIEDAEIVEETSKPVSDKSPAFEAVIASFSSCETVEQLEEVGKGISSNLFLTSSDKDELRALYPKYKNTLVNAN